METKQLPKFVEIVIDGIEQYKTQQWVEYKKKSVIASEISEDLYSDIEEHEATFRELSNFKESIKGKNLVQLQEVLSNKDIGNFSLRYVHQKKFLKMYTL